MGVLTTTTRIKNYNWRSLRCFVLGGKDTMIVHTTAPQQSWTNSAERVMLALNFKLPDTLVTAETPPKRPNVPYSEFVAIRRDPQIAPSLAHY